MKSGTLGYEKKIKMEISMCVTDGISPGSRKIKTVLIKFYRNNFEFVRFEATKCHIKWH